MVSLFEREGPSVLNLGKINYDKKKTKQVYKNKN